LNIFVTRGQYPLTVLSAYAEDHDLWPWMNAKGITLQSLVRRRVCFGGFRRRKWRDHGLCPWGSMQVLCSKCSKEVARRSLGRCPECGGILQPHCSDKTLLKLKEIEVGPRIDRYHPVVPVSFRFPYTERHLSVQMANRPTSVTLALVRKPSRCP
jgi:hypothetical protein